MNVELNGKVMPIVEMVAKATPVTLTYTIRMRRLWWADLAAFLICAWCRTGLPISSRLVGWVVENAVKTEIVEREA